jgi:hypothetical protein
MTVTGFQRFVTSREVSSQPLRHSREERRENDLVVVIRGDVRRGLRGAATSQASLLSPPSAAEAGCGLD